MRALQGVHDNQLSSILFDEQSSSLYAIERGKGLVKYAFATDTWHQQRPMHELPQHHLTSCTASTIDHRQNIIYICNSHYVAYSTQSLLPRDRISIVKVSINSGEQNEDELANFNTVGTRPQSLMINNEFHIIGGSYNNRHLKYNEETKQLEVLHYFVDGDIWRHRLVRIKQKLLLFGGSNWNDSKCTDAVHQYDISNNKWTKLNVKLPAPSCDFGCAPILNGRCVALFGGFNGHALMWMDDIWIYSIDKKLFRRSNIKCPNEVAEYQAITIKDKLKNELAVFGFVRNEWNVLQINERLFPPRYLLNIVQKYYLNEVIHLFAGGLHYAIDVFDIVSA